MVFLVFFFQAEDGIRDLVRSRGLGDVYKRQGTRNAADESFPRDCNERGGAPFFSDSGPGGALPGLSLIHI